MSRLCAVLLVVLLVAGSQAAAQPLLEAVWEQGEPLVIKQKLDLCLEGEGAWSLTASADSGLSFLAESGLLCSAGTLLSGRGAYQGQLGLEAHFASLELGVGRHRLELELNLEGAQGILGFFHGEKYWLLPLNQTILVESAQGEVLSAASGEWLVLEPGDKVLGNGEASLEAQGSPGGQQLRWSTPALHLAAGTLTLVELELVGPSPGGVLTLEAGLGLELGESWLLNGEVLRTRREVHRLDLEVPPLPWGTHRLQGELRVFLPGVTRQWVRASWQGEEALLPVEVNRSWFDEGPEPVRIESVGRTRLLFPAGQLRQAEGTAVFSVDSPGLDLLLPLDSPDTPIWLGLPFAQTRVWELNPEELPFVLVPILLWDQGFSWRLAAASSAWHGVLGAGETRFQAGWGTLELEVDRGRLSLKSGDQSLSDGESWQWRRSPQAFHGRWESRPWALSLELPRSGEHPRAVLQYRGEQVGFELGSRRVQVNFQGGTGWSGGADLARHAAWLHWSHLGLRLDLSPGRLSLDYRTNEHRLRLTYGGKKLQLAYRAGSWEGYLTLGEQESKWGVRGGGSLSLGPFLSETKGAVQFSQGLFLGQLRQRVGYPLTSWCTLYLQGTLRLSRSLDLIPGFGVVLTPSSPLVLAAGWEGEQGWHWKAGLVLPFIGRETVKR